MQRLRPGLLGWQRRARPLRLRRKTTHFPHSACRFGTWDSVSELQCPLLCRMPRAALRGLSVARARWGGGSTEPPSPCLPDHPMAYTERSPYLTYPRQRLHFAPEEIDSSVPRRGLRYVREALRLFRFFHPRRCRSLDGTEAMCDPGWEGRLCPGHGSHRCKHDLLIWLFPNDCQVWLRAACKSHNFSRCIYLPKYAPSLGHLQPACRGTWRCCIASRVLATPFLLSPARCAVRA